MSIINDALKKTQRMQSDPNEIGSPAVGGGYNGPRGRSSSGPSLTLLIVGGLVLVVVAIGGTVLLLRSKSAPVSSTTTIATAPLISAPTLAPTPAPVVAPSTPISTSSAAVVLPPVITLAKIEPTPAPVAATIAPSPSPVVATHTAAPVTTINPAAKAKVDVSTFIDAIHVTGVRFSEGSSKVLMNDRVYKVNDIVDRVLNIKLIEVGTDSLTFVDENGAVYKKSF